MSVTLLVATSGGHLAELQRIRPRLPDQGSGSFWITVDHPHARSLLRHESAFFVPNAPSRDLVAAVRNAWLTRPILKEVRPDWIVSNGASLAVSVLPQAAMMGIRCTFIENSVRVVGPSLSGRLVSYVAGIETFTQYAQWASSRWPLTCSALDEWEPVANPVCAHIRKIVVTVGTTAWPFRRLFEGLVKVVPPDVEILWQSGDTYVDDLGISGIRALPAHDLESAMRDADLVIAHAGIGSAMAAFEAGKLPLLVPRRSRFREAMDDHQVDIARELSRRGLCHSCEVEDLTAGALTEAASHQIRKSLSPPPFLLQPNGAARPRLRPRT